MGGAGYIFTGENDANVMHNSALINLNVAHQAVKMKIGKLFFSSSACVYSLHNQLDPDNPVCSEESAYPAAPDSAYGWGKLFSERLYLAPPHMVEHDEIYEKWIDRYNVRFVTKPGITGWAQVNGYRGATEDDSLMEKRIEHDLWYIKNWSIWLDVKIILLTIWGMLRRDKNAF